MDLVCAKWYLMPWGLCSHSCFEDVYDKSITEGKYSELAIDSDLFDSIDPSQHSACLCIKMYDSILLGSFSEFFHTNYLYKLDFVFLCR